MSCKPVCSSYKHLRIFNFGCMHTDLRTTTRCVSSQHWNSESSPRFEVFFSTRGRPLHLLLQLPCPPASTSPGKGLPGDLLPTAQGVGVVCRRRVRHTAIWTDRDGPMVLTVGGNSSRGIVVTDVKLVSLGESSNKCIGI